MIYTCAHEDILTISVKFGTCCREKSRITLSIKQLEEDPLLETLDKVIPQVWPTYLFSQANFDFTQILTTFVLHQDISIDPNALNGNEHFTIEPLPGLDTIIEELLKEDGYG